MTKRSFLFWFCGVLLAVGIGATISQRNTLGGLEHEHAQLLQRKAEMEKLFTENRQLPGLREQNQLVQKLRDENRDLFKLRNEIRQLRISRAELDKTRAENERIALAAQQSPSKPPVLPGYVTRDGLQNVGNATPENALQTALWAIIKGTPQDYKDGVFLKYETSDENLRDMKNSALEELRSFHGFAIAGKRMISKDQAILQVQGGVNGGKFPMNFIKVGNGWKFNP
jgi:hypothetical protein